MKRFDNGTIGNFIIPKKPKIEDDKIKKISTQTSNGKTGSILKNPSMETSTSSSRIHNPGNSSIWTGSLRFGEQIVESIDLYPPIRECSKPSGFSSCLEMQQLIKSKDFINYWPIQELIKELSRNNNNQSPLLKKRSIIICSSSEQKTTTPVRISYLFLINTFSPLFARICKEMMEKELIAFGLLSDFSLLFLIPNGQLSSQLGIPTRDGSVLHCLFISNISGIKNKFELYNFDAIPRIPSVTDKMNGNDPKIISKLESYQKESLLPINGLNTQRSSSTQPKQLESIFTPNQRPPGGKPVTPYIPTPGYPQPPPIHRHFPSRPSIAKQFFTGNQQQFHPYSPQRQQHPPTTSTSSDKNFLSILLAPPPPPPPPESEDISPPINDNSKIISSSSSTLERRQKNKAMIANAFEQIKSIGKTAVQTVMNEGTSPSKIYQPLMEQQQTDNLIRDPRLSRRITDSQPPPPALISSKELLEKKNGDLKIEENVKEKNDKTKKEFIEVLNESSSMEIVDEDSLLLSRPYSPSQVFMSSPEPMEEDEQPLNIEIPAKEKEELKKKENENIKNKCENEIIINEEDKKIKEKSEQSIDNISGVEGGEMPMDISLSSADLSTQITTNSNIKDHSPEPISSDSEKEGEDEEISETMFPQLISSSSSTGFGFDYLTWNTSSSSPLKNRFDQPDSPIKSTNNDKNIIGLEHFMHSNGELNINNNNKIQNEDKNKEEDKEDKDFRQFWSSIEIKQKEENINKSPTKIISSPPPPLSRPTSSSEIKNLPSLLDLNLTPPQSAIQKSVKPFSFFGGQFGNNVKMANSGQTQKQTSPVRPFFNICPETPINVQQQQQELLSKVVMGSLFRGRSRFPVPASNNDKGKYKLQRLDSPLYSTSLLPSSSNLNSQLLSSKEFLIKDPNLEIHIFREEKEIKGILVIDILIDTKILLTQLRRLLETAKKNSFLIKWHYILTKKLEQTTTNINENKEILTLLKLFEENKIIEKHFCDDSNKISENNIINYINYIFNEMMERRKNRDVIPIYFLNTDGQMNNKFIETCKEKNIQIMNICQFLDQKMIE